MFFTIQCSSKFFANFTEKHLCWSPFFNKVAHLKAYNFFIKQKLQYRCFSVKFAQFLRAHYRTSPVAVSVKILIRQFFREVKRKLIFANISLKISYLRGHLALLKLKNKLIIRFITLTLSWRRPLSYRNQWFLYDNGFRHKRVKRDPSRYLLTQC